MPLGVGKRGIVVRRGKRVSRRAEVTGTGSDGGSIYRKPLPNVVRVALDREQSSSRGERVDRR